MFVETWDANRQTLSFPGYSKVAEFNRESGIGGRLATWAMSHLEVKTVDVWRLCVEKHAEFSWLRKFLRLL